MSFVQPPMIFELIEGLLQIIWKEIRGVNIPIPFRE